MSIYSTSEKIGFGKGHISWEDYTSIFGAGYYAKSEEMILLYSDFTRYNGELCQLLHKLIIMSSQQQGTQENRMWLQQQLTQCK